MPSRIRTAYDRRLAEGRLSHDPSQIAVVEALTRLEKDLGRRGLFGGLHPSRSDRRRYAALLEELGLPLADRLDTMVGQLSGGQRQTISLVMATLGQPQLLLLDEHTAALDPRAEATVMELTERLVRRLGTTTLMVTHSLDQALRYGDRLVMLQDGRLIGDWSAAELAAGGQQQAAAGTRPHQGEKLAAAEGHGEGENPAPTVALP